MQIIQSLKSRLHTTGELFRLFGQNKWWWLSPMLILLLLIGTLIMLAESSVIAPFIYTLF